MIAEQKEKFHAHKEQVLKKLRSDLEDTAKAANEAVNKVPNPPSIRKERYSQ